MNLEEELTCPTFLDGATGTLCLWKPKEAPGLSWLIKSGLRRTLILETGTLISTWKPDQQYSED